LENSFLWPTFQRLWQVRLPDIAALCDSRRYWYLTVQISVSSRLSKVSLNLGFYFHYNLLAIQEPVKINAAFLLEYLMVCYKIKMNSSIPGGRGDHQLRTAFESTTTIEIHFCERWNTKNHWVIRTRRSRTFLHSKISSPFLLKGNLSQNRRIYSVDTFISSLLHEIVIISPHLIMWSTQPNCFSPLSHD
jgi:hypothetical protein